MPLENPLERNKIGPTEDPMVTGRGFVAVPGGTTNQEWFCDQTRPLARHDEADHATHRVRQRYAVLDLQILEDLDPLVGTGIRVDVPARAEGAGITLALADAVKMHDPTPMPERGHVRGPDAPVGAETRPEDEGPGGPGWALGRDEIVACCVKQLGK